MFDTHLHSKFSGDSDSEPPLIIDKAKELGLAGITFTDHLDPDYKIEPELFNLNIPAYYLAIEEQKRLYSSDDFFVGIGIELGLQPHLAGYFEDILSNYSFDFSIGSVHGIDGLDPYYDQFFEGYDIAKRYHEYFETVLLNINSFENFDTLAHLDYIKRYGDDFCFRNGMAVEELNEKELIREILKTLIKKDKSLEVNTGAFKLAATEPNPSYRILREYYDLGGRMITIGSDAHRLDQIALKFDEVKEQLLDIGFKTQIVYKNRVPNDYPL